MPRKKTAKHHAKRQSASHSSATLQKLEKDFLDAPAKIATQLKKEIAAHKQKELKLKNAAIKAKAQLKNAETRIQAAAKLKGTAAGKKQINRAKKAHNMMQKSHMEANKQLQDASLIVEAFLLKQAKLSAWQKNLNQFEKEWARQAKLMKAKANAQAAKVKSKAKVKKAAKVKNMISPIVEQPQSTESFETSEEHVRQEEATELTS